MDTTRIDHAAEARMSATLPVEEGHIYLNAMMYAQVHATLALVEQQRIANLIALGTVGMSVYEYQPEQSSIAAWKALATDTAEQGLRPDIAAALGIDS